MHRDVCHAGISWYCLARDERSMAGRLRLMLLRAHSVSSSQCDRKWLNTAATRCWDLWAYISHPASGTYGHISHKIPLVLNMMCISLILSFVGWGCTGTRVHARVAAWTAALTLFKREERYLPRWDMSLPPPPSSLSLAALRDFVSSLRGHPPVNQLSSPLHIPPIPNAFAPERSPLARARWR